MPIKYDELMALKNFGQKYAYTDREVMLYAYGIGMGADPMDERELAFVNEAVATPRALKVIPTFASVAAWGAGPGEMNLNRVMVVDGERDITFHRPLTVSAHITADSSVLDVFDKGKEKGAVIRHKTVLKNENGEELATLVASRFARGDLAVIAYLKGEPAGYAWMSFTTGVVELAFGVTWIIGPGESVRYDYFVLPEWRGRRINSCLHSAIVARARDLGIVRTFASVSALNTQSLSLPRHQQKIAAMKLTLVHVSGLNSTFHKSVGAPFASRFLKRD